MSNQRQSTSTGSEGQLSRSPAINNFSKLSNSSELLFNITNYANHGVDHRSGNSSSGPSITYDRISRSFMRDLDYFKKLANSTVQKVSSSISPISLDGDLDSHSSKSEIKSSSSSSLPMGVYNDNLTELITQNRASQSRKTSEGFSPRPGASMLSSILAGTASSLSSFGSRCSTTPPHIFSHSSIVSNISSVLSSRSKSLDSDNIHEVIIGCRPLSRYHHLRDELSQSPKRWYSGLGAHTKDRKYRRIEKELAKVLQTTKDIRG